MKANIIEGKAPGGERIKLAGALPLDTPLLVEIFPIYACNFTCKYCIFSVEKEKRGFISGKIAMDFDLYLKCIDDLAQFPRKVKVLRFAGMGEPLLHKDIVDMVAYAKARGVVDKIEILTNGSLLTPQMSNSLIQAGLSKLLVSLQGMTGEKYYDVCGVRLDIGKFIGNLKYFYEHRDRTQLHIKMIDYALGSKEDKDKFYGMFEDVCDTIGIEYASPIYPYVDYDSVLGKDNGQTQFGIPLRNIVVCPQPFFRIHIIPDGKIIPCYSMVYPIVVGDANGESLYETWNNEKLREFRCRMLDGVYGLDVCRDCRIIKYRAFPEDNLNSDVERLRKIYE